MDTHRATASLPWIDGPAVRAALSPRAAVDALEAVSYTHLTLPTIYSV